MGCLPTKMYDNQELDYESNYKIDIYNHHKYEDNKSIPPRLMSSSLNCH